MGCVAMGSPVMASGASLGFFDMRWLRARSDPLLLGASDDHDLTRSILDRIRKYLVSRASRYSDLDWRPRSEDTSPPSRPGSSRNGSTPRGSLSAVEPSKSDLVSCFDPATPDRALVVQSTASLEECTISAV